MGRVNVCVLGAYEGLFYIDNDDLRVYRKDDPGTDECEDRLQRDLDYADITGPDWHLDEVGSSYEEANVLECIKTALLTRLPEIGTYAGAWTSGRITREENENETAQMS